MRQPKNVAWLVTLSKMQNCNELVERFKTPRPRGAHEWMGHIVNIGMLISGHELNTRLPVYIPIFTEGYRNCDPWSNECRFVIVPWFLLHHRLFVANVYEDVHARTSITRILQRPCPATVPFLQLVTSRVKASRTTRRSKCSLGAKRERPEHERNGWRRVWQRERTIRDRIAFESTNYGYFFDRC